MLKLLLKTRLLAWFRYLTGGGARSAFKNKGGKGKTVLFGLLYIYVIFACGAMFFGWFSLLASPFYEMGLGWLYFGFFFISAFALMFVMSIFTAKSQLFEAKDNELLLSMPIPPSAVLGSRMASLLLINFGFCLLVAIPAMAAWCMTCPVNPLGIVAFVLVCIFLPFFSLAISSLFGWLLAMLTARVKRKNLVSTVASLCFLGGYFYVISNINAILQSFILNGQKMADSISVVTPLYGLAMAMAEGELSGLIIGLPCLIVPFAVAYIILARTFIRTVTTRRGSAKKRYVKKEAKVASPFAAFVRREWQRFFSSSLIIMNCGLGCIMTLIVAGAIIIKGGQIRDMLSQVPEMEGFIAPIIIVALCAMAGMVTYSACAVSLEGKYIWIVRSMPTDTKLVLFAKMLVHLILSAPGMLLAQIAAIIVFRVSGAMLLWMLLLPQLYNLFLIFLGLWANLKMPKMEWQSEVQAVKQGFSVMIPILGGWAIMVLPVVAVVIFGAQAAGIVAAVFAAILALAIFGLYKWIITRGVEIFENL
ncbi:MAG: hypothetical protein IKV79_03615 [Oscillospiraceae bacterium]|nr:hypothetical protein [Oscillospiraceae bacterium]